MDFEILERNVLYEIEQSFKLDNTVCFSFWKNNEFFFGISTILLANIDIKVQIN